MIPSNSRSNQNQLNKQGLLLPPVLVLFAWMPAPCSCLAGQRAAAPGRLIAERAAEWCARAGQQSAGLPATCRGARGEGQAAEAERRATEAGARRGRPVTGGGDDRRRAEAERRAACGATPVSSPNERGGATPTRSCERCPCLRRSVELLCWPGVSWAKKLKNCSLVTWATTRAMAQVALVLGPPVLST